MAEPNEDTLKLICKKVGAVKVLSVVRRLF